MSAVEEVKAKKTPAKKRSSSSHPSYEEMIKDAIVTLKERTGSSQYAIQKFIEEKHKTSLPPTFRKLLLLNLKRLVGSGKLVKVKASFKIPAAAATAPAKKKPVVKPKAKVAKVAAKPKATTTKTTTKAVATKPKAKSKSVAVVSKTKAVAAKPKAKERPAKASRTSSRTSPGKKVAPVKSKKAVVAKKKSPVKKSVKAKSVKSPAKRASTRKVKK